MDKSFVSVAVVAGGLLGVCFALLIGGNNGVGVLSLIFSGLGAATGLTVAIRVPKRKA